MKLSHIALLAVLGTSIATPVFSQPASGQGMGSGMGPGQGRMGAGPAATGCSKATDCVWSKANTAGWSLMSMEERAAHKSKMRAAKTYDECKSLQTDHHAAMEARAKEKGVTLPAPRQNGCDRMKARGFYG